ncbi:MAG: hypothetical protein IT287_01565 [Bdellovibrionaceae bacterium]|nr:hypothetical protein [Pseudobdellovibrionaceae bacterium]
MIVRQYLLVVLLFFVSTPVFAQNIEWNQPEVVQEKLMRENRRVLSFSGTATPGTQIRVRDNKVKMIFNKKNVRWARLPQKHRVQFPVIASDTGYFAFQLYLPTTDVEIPLEVFKKGKWVPYKFSFEVPEEGPADSFKFIEESFKYKKEEENVKVEDFLSEYDKKADQGQVVNDRGEWKSWSTGKVLVWGSLGGMYYSLDQTLSQGDDLGTFGSFEFPAWEVGAEYRWSEEWKIEGAYMNRAGSAAADGNYTMQNEEFNWTEFRANVTYFSKDWESAKSRFGAKAGLQMHDIPFVKRVGNQQYRVFNNNMVFLAAGGAYETMNRSDWNYDISAMLIYPVMVDDEFDVDSAYGLYFNFSMLKEVIPALFLGAKVDVHWINMEVTHAEKSIPTQTVSVDGSLWHITPSFLVKAEF